MAGLSGRFNLADQSLVAQESFRLFKQEAARVRILTYRNINRGNPCQPSQPVHRNDKL